MAGWKRYLTEEELRAVANAAIDAGLAEPSMLTALMRSIPRRYTGMLSGGNLPINMRLGSYLDQMNRVHNLVTGEVPLALFLAEMIDSTSDTKPLGVFQAALAKVTTAAPPPAPPPPIGFAPAGLAVAAAPIMVGANKMITPEAQVSGSDETLPIRYLRQGSEAARSVFKIVIHLHTDGVPEFITDDRPKLSNGTGWLIAPSIGITNHHVINARLKSDAQPADFKLQAETAKVRFDYYESDTLDGVPLGQGTLLASDKDLDFALLRLPAELAGRRPLRLRQQRIVKRLEQPFGTRVNVLQHPYGNPMKLGFRNNFVVLGDETVLAYLTDTAVGSSGSPVCDDAWAVAALHHGSRPVSDEKLELMGKLIKQENVGTPMRRILQHLEVSNPALHQEITAAQAGLAP